MWKSAQYIKAEKDSKDDDDWETDPDFVVSLFRLFARPALFNLILNLQNDVSEQDQRWGSKTVEGSGRTAAAIEYVLFEILFFIY